MGVAQKWVFPIIRVLLVAVLAGALVKLAFFADNAEPVDPAFPTGEITQPQIPVALGTITNNVTVKGTVNADAAVPVKATGIGSVDEIFIPEGKKVTKGDKIFDIRVETILDPVETTDKKGVVTITQPEPAISFAKVYAPISGVLSSLDVIPGQIVAVGDVSGQVAPPSFSVSGSLSPEQLYSLVDEPTEAEITITGGPAAFTCTGLKITTPLAGAGEGGSPAGGVGASGGDAASGTVLHCAIPKDIKVFSGLAADITIAGGKAENVLTVPTTAVQGATQNGVVWFVLPDGTTEERPVTLGLHDGMNVEISDGVAEGDMVLQFVPGAVPVDPGMGFPGEPMPSGGENCYQTGDGGTICEG